MAEAAKYEEVVEAWLEKHPDELEKLNEFLQNIQIGGISQGMGLLK